MVPGLSTICESPLLKSCGFVREDVAKNQSEWLQVAGLIQDHLDVDKDNMTPAQESRVYQYYTPVSMWVESQLAIHRASSETSALVVGISAPQGCGKSTIVECLEAVLSARGIKSVNVSIDDFYLTREEQDALASTYEGNPLLELRGNAGSHDVQLGRQILEKMKSEQDSISGQ